MNINVNEQNGSTWIISRRYKSWLLLLYLPFYVLYLAFLQDRLPPFISSFISMAAAIAAFLIVLALINTYLRYRAKKVLVEINEDKLKGRPQK
ncbi:MAG: hypothetical protein QXP36_11415 [Conexivisphaerales archaeon]